MQKSKTAAWKANSTRNRHNGRINADKQYVLNHKDIRTFGTSDGRKYGALLYQDSIKQPSGDPLSVIKSRIVRMA